MVLVVVLVLMTPSRPSAPSWAPEVESETIILFPGTFSQSMNVALVVCVWIKQQGDGKEEILVVICRENEREHE